LPHPPDTKRRAILAGAAALAGAAWLPIEARQGDRTRLILLGTGGGPRPRKASSAPAQVIVAKNTACVVDCGNGVARQLVLADIPLDTLRHVFITHHHSDHNADYGNLIWLAWAQAAGVKTLVLSHLVPAEDPEVTEQMWIDAARVHFRGPVIVGRDLLEI
jgi:ribonuclease BN (tRNA processing enzyme)